MGPDARRGPDFFDRETNMSEKALTGKVVSWNSERGYGFIKRDDNGETIFVHGSQIVKDHFGETRGRKELSVGDEVTFQVELGDRGAAAICVTVTKALDCAVAP